jgi:hypothetical protein
MTTRRYLLVEVEVGGEEGSDPEQSIPTVQDWGAYKRFLQSIVGFGPSHDWNVKVNSVSELLPSGIVLHSVSLGPSGFKVQGTTTGRMYTGKHSIKEVDKE